MWQKEMQRQNGLEYTITFQQELKVKGKNNEQIRKNKQTYKAIYSLAS